MSLQTQTPATSPAAAPDSPSLSRILPAYWPALLTALVSLTLCIALAWMRHGQTLAAEEAQVQQELNALRSRLEAVAQTTFAPTLGLEALIRLDGGISDARFQAMSSQVIRLLPHVRSIVAAPNDVAEFVYPLAGNEAVYRLDYRGIPRQYEQVQLARRLGQPLLVGPVQLVQGGQGLIQRVPVFLPRPEGQTPQYWGVISVVADLPRFMESTGLANRQDLRLGLYHTGQPAERLGAVIWGDRSLPQRRPVLQTVNLPGAVWTLAAVPAQGWSQGPSWRSIETALAVGVSLVLTWLAGLLVYRRRLLVSHNRALAEEIAHSRQVQSALDAEHARFRSLTELSTDWVWEQDRELRLSYISRPAEKASQVPSQALLGMKRWESPALVPGVDWAAHQAMLERHEAFRDFEYAHYAGDGSVRYVSVSGTPFFDANGEFAGYRGTGRNITAAKQAEQALIESQAALTETLNRLQAILDSASEVAIIATDLDGRITVFNRGAERMLGYNEREMLGRYPDFLHRREEVRQRAVELSAELGETIQGFDTFVAKARMLGSETRVWTYLRKDGSALDVSLTVSLVRDRGGPAMGYLGIARDITEQRQAERALVQLNAELEDRVSSRTIELTEAMHTLRQAQDELLRSEKMAALGSLVAGVAHELNTPLGNCLTTASTLEERTREIQAEFEGTGLRRQRLADYLRDAGTAASILLRSLSTSTELVAHFKQLSVDQTSSQRRVFDLASALDDVLSLLRPRLRTTPYQVVCEVHTQRPLDSYPGPLGQVINNLVLNALLHAFGGREHGRLSIRADELSPDWLLLVVEDDGVGMSEAVRRRAFDPFFTTKMGSGGTGLGLNIVYNIVTGILGGQIELSSEPGKGSRFTFRLPYVAPQLSAKAEERAHDPRPVPKPPNS
ncbi:PAS domain S-box protein [Kinneretia aquatilis]|uniref:PAS domain S-box protein n=1 Tax=Kinneretia aquatilis TaxID=2070761 RepID=UPI0014953649|nr:PAS domain S-box protein [Paucibacter aquatile]WIV99854.1 PAS domain S-box protein [Paucibacter aquatile]